MWLYADGSSGEPGHVAAIQAFLPDDTTRVLCLSSPHPSSLGSEFWGAIAAIRLIHREFSQYEVCLLIDNDQVVSTLQKCQASEPNPFRDDTWTIAVHSALHLIINPLHVLLIKGHANFVGCLVVLFVADFHSRPTAAPPPPGPPPPCLSFINSKRSNFATYCRKAPITT